MIDIFIDTNVWFSAFYGSTNCQKIITAHIEKKIKAAISQDVLNELVRNISLKIPNAQPGLEFLLKSSPPSIVKTPTKISSLYTTLADHKDLPILLAASEAHIKIFTTGNIADFNIIKIKKKLGIDIISPSKLVDMLNLS